MRSIMIILLLSVGSAFAQQQYRLCTPESISNSEISSVTKGNSQIACVRVTDSADCAIKINKKEADFGIFNAEELLLAYQFYPRSFSPIVQLKHKDRIDYEFEFRTVAVVPRSLNPNEGLDSVRNSGLCHPGFSESQTWNDYILKFFEKKVHDNQCNDSISVGENEAINIKKFFGKACRPGNWVAESSYDSELKKKYPELCELCDDKIECKYSNTQNHGHMGALDCLTSGKGKVAYVAYHYALQYFKIDHKSTDMTQQDYQLLCPNGALQPLTVTNPCAWIQQPWSAIVTRKEEANIMIDNLKNWLKDPVQRSMPWTDALSDILQKDGNIVYFQNQPTLKSYLVKGREVNLPEKSCGKKIRWCTVDEVEKTKCKWIAKEAQLLGIEPQFMCDLKYSKFDCLANISANQADIITIDSNYGYLARRIYNLTTVLYAEAEKEKNSVILAIVRNNSMGSVKSFKDIKNKRVCFPDYGGIAWLSFINALRNENIIDNNNNYLNVVADFLMGACTPGINDIHHSDVHDLDIIQQLCSICPTERSNATCSANINNQYYGDIGALKCLSGPGDIAFIEIKNIKEHIDEEMISPHEFRVLCKNGSLANYVGFDVDDNCALSVTIDSEIIGRKEETTIDTLDTILALLKIENWFGYRPYSRRAIKIYESFEGYKDLLFKDSTVGLEPVDSNITSITAYKDLFQFLDSINTGIRSSISSFIIIGIPVAFIISYF